MENIKDKMRKSLEKELNGGICCRYLILTADTLQKEPLADALCKLQCHPENVFLLNENNDSVSFYLFGEEFGIGKKLADLLPGILVSEEEAWNHYMTEVFRDGHVAIYGKDYAAQMAFEPTISDDETETDIYYDTEFHIFRPDGTLFAEGGAGMVPEKELSEYLHFTKWNI